MSEEKMILINWIKEQFEEFDKHIQSVKDKVNKLMQRSEERKKIQIIELADIKADLKDTKTSVNIILESLKK